MRDELVAYRTHETAALWLAPYLRLLWRRLVESFCGGLAISLELRPQAALLNDANTHLINFYVWL